MDFEELAFRTAVAPIKAARCARESTRLKEAAHYIDGCLVAGLPYLVKVEIEERIAELKEEGR